MSSATTLFIHVVAVYVHAKSPFARTINEVTHDSHTLRGFGLADESCSGDVNRLLNHHLAGVIYAFFQLAHESYF